MRKFLNDEVPAFGHYYSQFEGDLDRVRHRFIMRVNDLSTREMVLQWYLDLNGGGIAHTGKSSAR